MSAQVGLIVALLVIIALLIWSYRQLNKAFEDIKEINRIQGIALENPARAMELLKAFEEKRRQR